MTFRWSLGVEVMLVSGLVSALTADYVRRRPGAVGRSALGFGLAAAAVWSFAYALELGSTTVAAKTVWAWVKYLGVCALPPAWLVFSLQYTGRERRVTRRLVAWLGVVPVCVLVLLAAPATTRLVRFYPPGPLDPHPVVGLGPAFWLLLGYSMAVAFTGTWLVVFTLLRVSRIYRHQAVLLGSALTLVWTASILSNVGGVDLLGLIARAALAHRPRNLKDACDDPALRVGAIE